MEHERRFLVVGGDWPRPQTPRRLTQGYLSVDPDRTVRVRRQAAEAWITVKGRNRNGSRPEFEYPIPAADAEHMLVHLCKGQVIDKWRYLAPAGIAELPEAHWEIDEFMGANLGLVIAELEVPSREQLALVDDHRPSWLGREITGEHRYANSALVHRPYSQWSADEQAG